MDKKRLLSTLLIAVVGVTIGWGVGQVIKKSKKTDQEAVVVQTKGRVLDYGFKLKINECVTINGEDFVVVDVDTKDTYVLASAKQYYVGPYPITESMLKKVSAKDTDQNPLAAKMECKQVEEKYQLTASETVPDELAGVKLKEAAVEAKKEKSVSPKKAPKKVTPPRSTK